MVNIFGEANVRTNANNHSTPVTDECVNARAVGESGQAQSSSAVAIPTGVDTNVRTLPPAVTEAEKAEERLGIVMLRAALENPRVPNPEKWRQHKSFANAMRQQATRQRRELVRQYAEEGILTVQQAARALGVVSTTVRTDCQVLRVRLRASTPTINPYQKNIYSRREKLEEMAPTGITRAAAAAKLGVSESTVRRDLMIMKLNWEGKY